MKFKVENINGTIKFAIHKIVNDKYEIFGILTADFIDNNLEGYDFFITRIYIKQKNKTYKTFLIPLELRKEFANAIELEFIRPNIIYFDKEGNLKFQAPKIITDPIKINIYLKKLEKIKKIK